MNGDLPPRVGDLLAGISKRTGIDAPIETARLWSRWREVVGPELASHAEPTSLKKGVLRVRADSPVWATEIGYLGEEIRARANDAAGDSIVAEVRVWTGPGKPAKAPVRGTEPRWTKPRPSASDDGAQDDPLTVFQRVRTAWAGRRAGAPPRPS